MTADFERQLGSAIRSDLDSEPVDVSAILGATRAAMGPYTVARPTGSTSPAPQEATLALVEALPEDTASVNAVRVRVDRQPTSRARSLIAVFASAASIAAITFGLFALREGSAQPHGDRPASGAAQAVSPTPTGSAASPPTSAPATPTAKSATQDSPPTRPSMSAADKKKAIKADVAYLIPTDQMAFKKSELAGLGGKPELLDALGDYRLTPTIDGQMCDSGDSKDYDAQINNAPLWPVAASSMAWTFSTKTQDSINLLVTGWAEGSVDKHWADLVKDKGPCRFSYLSQKPVPESLGGADPQRFWFASYKNQAGYGSGYGAARVGNVIVAVTWSGIGAPPMNKVRELTELAAKRAQSSGLVDTASGVTGIPSQPNFP